MSRFLLVCITLQSAFSPCSGTGWRRWLDCALDFAPSDWGEWVPWVEGLRYPHHPHSSPSESGSDLAWQTACRYHHSDTQKGKAKSWKVLEGWRAGVGWGGKDKVLSSCFPCGRETGLDLPPMGACSWLPLTHSHSAIIPESRGVDAGIYTHNKITVPSQG